MLIVNFFVNYALFLLSTLIRAGIAVQGLLVSLTKLRLNIDSTLYYNPLVNLLFFSNTQSVSDY